MTLAIGFRKTDFKNEDDEANSSTIENDHFKEFIEVEYHQDLREIA